MSTTPGIHVLGAIEDHDLAWPESMASSGFECAVTRILIWNRSYEWRLAERVESEIGTKR